MTGTFDGNDGNDGNAANAGGAGNATSASAGWFFADRVDLPFVTVPDSGPRAIPPTTIGQLTIIPDIMRFPARNWSAEWFSWLALIEFAASNWRAIQPAIAPPAPFQQYWPIWVPPPPPPNGPLIDWSVLNPAVVQAEIAGLVIAAANERADALGDILSQANEFISYFLNMLTANPGAYPQTTKVLTLASQVGTFVAMYFKGLYKRPRASELCPALLPPIEVPGHASFPSGHSTQAHLMALCINDIFNGLPQQNTILEDAWTLADSIARNREIAGLHYPSDSDAGRAIALATLPALQASVPIFLAGTSLGGVPLAGTNLYQHAVTLARTEWQLDDGP
jgi:membrane-associated phospholipid phosphatase